MYGSLKHGSRADNGTPRYHAPRKPRLTAEQDIALYGDDIPPMKFRTKAHKEAKMSHTLYATSSAKTGTVIDGYPDAKPGDLTPMKVHRRMPARIKPHTVRVSELADAIGVTTKFMVTLLTRDYHHYVVDGRSTVPSIVADRLLGDYGVKVVPTSEQIVADLTPMASTRGITSDDVPAWERALLDEGYEPIPAGQVLANLIGAEKAITEAHEAMPTDTTAGCGVGCTVTACSCGAHYVTHNAKCVHADPRSVGCPAKAATRKVMYGASTRGAA
jgi:hypothetical protein